ncbi:MAG TPA: polysaccharide deacetylase family protein [Vicinamibacterales bacterium]|nr:polysaccharide deacetylase family protein [Vicinamibacterales bacterium]
MIAVLLYHGIDDGRPSPRPMDDIDREYVLSRARFEAHIDYLAHVRADAVPVAISFDDGDASCYTIAAPLLERHGLRGLFFVVTGWIGRPGFMTADELCDLVRRGHAVHSHSRTHPKLSSLTPAEMDDELSGSKADLEALVGRPVTQVSIPGGAYDDRVIEAARRAGYEAVFTSVEGYNQQPDAFLRRRFTPRTYSEVSMLRDICEHPARTRARIAVKRSILAAAHGVLGSSRYGRLRGRLMAALRGPRPPE